jgi:hypothetical protein
MSALIEVDTDTMRRMIFDLKATEQQADKAMFSTMSKMAAWVRTRSVRGLSDKLKIQQKILRGRTRTFRWHGGGSSSVLRNGDMKVWYGLNPVPWSRLSPRASKKGGVAAVGNRHDPEAFIANYGGHPEVLKRKGKARNPLEVIKADIHDPSVTYIEDFVLAGAEFENQFMKIFERELKWRTATRR